MSPTAQFAVSLEGGGIAIKQMIERTGDHPSAWEVDLPVGYAGTLTTRTDGDTGTITLAGGHAITTGMDVDIYWEGGVQYGATVGTVATNSMPFNTADAVHGDALPVLTTPVVVTPRVVVTTPIDGDNLKIIGLALETSEGTAGKATIDMREDSDAQIAKFYLVGSEPQIYDVQSLAADGQTTHFSGNPIASSYASNGSSSVAATLKILALEDSTP